MYFLVVSALYGVSFLFALEYFGWPVASIWLIGGIFAIYKVIEFASTVWLSSYEARFGEEM